MSNNQFSFDALIKFGDTKSPSSDNRTYFNQQQLQTETLNAMQTFPGSAYQQTPQYQLPIQEIEYIVQNNNRLVHSFNQADTLFSDIIPNLRSRQIKTKEIDPQRIICRDANSYYIRIQGADVLISTIKLLSCIIINPRDGGRFDAIYCEFEIEKNNITSSTNIPIVITEDEYLKGNFASKINRLITDRSNLQLNSRHLTALFFYLIQNEINIPHMYLPSCSGWYMTESGLLFASANIVHPLIDNCLKNGKYKGYTEEIKNRKLLCTNRALDDIAYEYKTYLPDNWKYKLIVVMRVASLLLYFFKEKGIEPDQIFIIEREIKSDAKDIIALLQTLNYSTFSPIQLPFSKTDFDKISTELFSNDGIALFRDSSCLEERTKLDTSIKLLEHEMRYSDIRKNKKRQFITIISDNYANIYEDFPAMYLNFNDSNCVSDLQDIQKLQKLSGEFDFALIQEIINNQSIMTDKINTIIDNHKVSATDEISEKINTVYILESTMTFLKEYEIINTSDIEEIHKWIYSSDTSVLDNQTRIVNDFYNALNSLIHTGEIQLAKQCGEPFYDQTQNMAFESKDYLNFGDNVFKKLILPNMNITKRSTTVLNTLFNENIFPPHKGSKQFASIKENKRTLLVAAGDGKRKRVSVYSVLTELLDARSKSKLAVIKDFDFFYHSPQLPISNFAPVIKSLDNDYTAGIQIAPDSDENFHMYVTGRSGAGKTYFLIQQALFHTKTDDKIIIFDNGGYFGRDRLEKFFKDETDKIIDEFISFHNILTDKIPVDLFSLEGCGDSSYFQAARLYNILTAASENFGEKQINTLNEGLKEAVKLITSGVLSDVSDEHYSKEICKKIINIITSNKISELNIDDRLINIINFVKEINITHQTWGDFLEKQKKIVIITTGKERNKIGANLIDLMLASLYAYKTHTGKPRFSVIIDEISFLNLSGSGTISSLARASRQTKISLILASQDFMKEKLNTYLGNFNMKVFFQPTDCNIVANYINSPEIDSNLLSALETDECVVVGNLYNKFKESNCHSILSGKTAEFIGSQYYPIELSVPCTEKSVSVEIAEPVLCTEINDDVEETSASQKHIETKPDTQVDIVAKTYLNVKVLIEDTKDETIPE